MKRGRVEFEQNSAVTLRPQEAPEMPPAYTLGPSMMDTETDSASVEQQQQLAGRLEAMRQQIELDCLAQQRHMAAITGNGFASMDTASDPGRSAGPESVHGKEHTATPIPPRPSTLKLNPAERNPYNSLWAHCALLITKGSGRWSMGADHALQKSHRCAVQTTVLAGLPCSERGRFHATVLR